MSTVVTDDNRDEDSEGREGRGAGGGEYRGGRGVFLSMKDELKTAPVVLLSIEYFDFYRYRDSSHG